MDKKVEAYVKLAEQAIASKVKDLQLKYETIKKICLIYCFIILLILAVAFFRLLYWDIAKKILRPDMGNIALACFVAIQISFELDEEKSRKLLLLRLKAFFYVVNVCILINTKVGLPLTICSCVFAILQLIYMFHSLSQEQAKLRYCLPKTPQAKFDQTKLSLGILAINFVALSVGIVSACTSYQIHTDVVLSIILGALVMYYVHTIIKAKTQQLLSNPDKLREKSIMYLAFKIVKPLGNTLLGHMKKFKFS